MRTARLALWCIIALLVIAFFSLNLLGDFWWFRSVGYGPVFLKTIFAAAAIGLLSFAFFFAVSYANIRLAAKAGKGRSKRRRPKMKTRVFAVVSAVAGLVAALAMSANWGTVLKYFSRAAFGAPDPVFGFDIGFFVFEVPFYSLVFNFLLATFIFSAVAAAVTYVLNALDIRLEGMETGEKEKPEFVFTPPRSKRVKFNWTGSWDRFMPQISMLLFLVFMIIAGRIWLSQFEIMYSAKGTFYGAGYTDVNVTLPFLSILFIVSLVIAFMFLANIKLRKAVLIRDAIAAFILIAFLGMVAGAIIQAFIVAPDEFNLEKPFIERNIQSTLAAYGLDSVQEEQFAVGYNMTADELQKNNATIGNVRLWDWRPLTQTYQQLQLFRTYYDFHDMDIDRYWIGNEYKQVIVSAREMDTDALSDQAQTWVNRHLVYTHGYGVVMNPVDKVTDEGLPVFYIKDIPPSSGYFNISQPGIYFGERENDYVIVNTDTGEFDYPSGEQNIYASYKGDAGISLSGMLSRLVYAVKFRSIELLVSGSLKPESRLLMNRNIMNRVEAIAPFLAYDPDPYMAIIGGKLYWIIDAYTSTDRYPYSEAVSWNGSGEYPMNYIRNSVKVVVDAYTGDTRFFAVDEKDPILKAYRDIFPGLFLGFGDMPEEFKAHMRYPEQLFNIQAQIYATYHMKDPMVFYNKEDVWIIPDEIYRDSRQKIMPYYVILKLPGSDTRQALAQATDAPGGPKEEFVMMIPFTPRGKENLIGWMAARADAPNYGSVLVYQFSKQELTYGPMQFEARVDQSPDISQYITLWSQAGSSVVRGNTLVIPIENSLLYVEPLYLEATEKGTLPQLQRVIVAYGDKLTMQKTLKEALDAIFGQSQPQAGSSGAAGQAAEGTGEPGGQTPATGLTLEEKLSRIAGFYDKAQEALKQGNLSLYQQYVDKIGQISGCTCLAQILNA